MSQPDTVREIYTYDDEETFTYDGAIPFVCTDKFYYRCVDMNINAQQFIEKLSRQRVYLMAFSNNTDYINVLSDEAILSCAINDDNKFIITTLFEKTVSQQNRFIKSGLKVRVSKPASIENIRNVISHLSNPSEATSQFSKVKESFLKQLHTVSDIEYKDYDDDEEIEGISDYFESILLMAEEYVVAEDEIQRALAQSGPMISYYEVEASLEHKRVDNLAYRFTLSDIDEKVYNVGNQVTLQLQNGEAISGKIIELYTEDTPYYMTVLFAEQFDISELPPVGTISLEYNNVMREVRLNVIEDLQNRSSRAMYLDDVIGEQHFAGFRDVNLDSTIERLNALKYPPNESQLDAIKRGIQTNDMMLVLGPPGTGKTTVILEWVKYFVLEENKRVLVSSQNNKAVDNVLERLMEERAIDTIRIGNEEKVQANVQHLMFEERAYELQQQINKSNKMYLEKINAIKIATEEMIDALNEVIPQAQLLQVASLFMDRLYDELYNEYIAPLIRLKETDRTQKKTLINYEERYTEALQYLHTFDNYHWSQKLYTFPKATREWFVKKVIPGKHQKLSKQNKMTVEQYNVTADQMERFYNDELSLIKESYSTLNLRWDEDIKRIKSVQITDLKGEKMNFSIDQITKQNAYGELQKLLQRLQSIQQQHEKIEASLIRWRTILEEKKNYALTKILLESVDLVGATCIGINSQRRFQDLDFDVTIIDEAGQIQIQDVIVPMSRSSKTIMLGDHLQIPPIADDDVVNRVEEAGIDSSLLQKSFFEFLYDEFPDENKILLDTQYRMPNEIADLLSEWFYDGEYHSFEGKHNLPSLFPHLFTNPFVIVDTSKLANRYETAIPNKGYYNECEAEQIVQLISKTIKEVNVDDEDFDSLLSVEDVGIITPYSQQVRYVRELLLERFPTLTKEIVQDLVASLDSFQGQERKMIIYSCTRSNRQKPQYPRIGFLKELRRLNVALSRCQEQLIFIGDIPFLSSCEYVETDEYGQEILDDFGNPIMGKSEKEFAKFIQLMMQYAKDGKAQHILANEI